MARTSEKVVTTDAPPPGPQIKGEVTPSQIFWCDYCQFLLNGHEQVYDHVRGRKHTRNVFRTVDVLPDDGISPVGLPSGVLRSNN